MIKVNEALFLGVPSIIHFTHQGKPIMCLTNQRDEGADSLAPRAAQIKHCVVYASNCPSNCDGRGRGDVCDRTLDTSFRTGQPRTLSDDRGNAALERRGVRMPERMEHHRDERAVTFPIPTPFSYSYIPACNQSEIAHPQIAA